MGGLAVFRAGVGYTLRHDIPFSADGDAGVYAQLGELRLVETPLPGSALLLVGALGRLGALRGRIGRTRPEA